jgi:hypothetical protein
MCLLSALTHPCFGERRSIGVIKQVVRSAVTDAEGATRKTARQLYWVLHSSPALQSHMRGVFKDLDVATQRHIQTEASADSPELNDLLRIQRDPSVVSVQTRRAEAQDAREDEVKLQEVKPRQAPSVGRGGAQGSTSSEMSSRALSTSAAVNDASEARTVQPPKPPAAVSDSSEWGAVLGDEAIHGFNSGRRASTALDGSAATALKPSRRMSLSAGPIRVAQPGATSASTAVPSPAGASQASMFASTVGAATVASLLAQQPSSKAQSVAATPAPKQSRPSVPSATDSAGDESSQQKASTQDNVPPSTYMNRRLGSAGLGSTAPVGGLADGPKRILRATPTVPAVPAAVPGASDNTVAPAAASIRMHMDTIGSVAGAFSSDEPTPLIEEQEAETQPPTQPVLVFSAETLRALLCSSEWSDRVRALETMNQRLQRAVDANEALSSTVVESFLDLGVPVLGDPHHKVATEAMAVVHTCVTAFPDHVHCRLSPVTLAVFHRLGDRRQDLRDAANAVLNLLRAKVDPVSLMAAVAPRMVEVPDRMKTALMQFLSAVAPHCEEYFTQAAHTRTFLGRLAHILEGPGGVKPSATLTVAARRLLELVYRTTPTVRCPASTLDNRYRSSYRTFTNFCRIRRWSALRLQRCLSSSRSC